MLEEKKKPFKYYIFQIDAKKKRNIYIYIYILRKKKRRLDLCTLQRHRDEVGQR
jgi:hypothetical protein